jgi:hypothetical protein
MSMPIDLLLDECLDQIRQGQSLESCLAAHPREAEALRPLLETAAALDTVTVQRSSEAAFHQGRERMIAAVEQEFPAQAVSGSAFSRYSVRILTWITGKDNVDMKLATRLAMAVVLVLALVVVAGLGTTAVSASNALPGDALYPVKTSAQNVQLMFTWNAEARQALESHFQEEYRNDVRTLMQDGRQAQVRFVGTLDAVDNNLWVVGGLPVSVDQATTLSGNLQPGDVVLVEAVVQKDGSILASHLSLDGSAGRHPEDLPATPVNTPALTPAPTLLPTLFLSTMAPEHHEDDPEHVAPLATPQPSLSPEHPEYEPEHEMEHASTLAPTAAPEHHDDGATGGHDSGHDATHDDSHDGEHD